MDKKKKNLTQYFTLLFNSYNVSFHHFRRKEKSESYFIAPWSHMTGNHLATHTPQRISQLYRVSQKKKWT